jgi:hypothetical protein
MKKTQPVLTLPDIEGLIVTLRGQKVILDADLARIYGVPTRALNQAVKRNLARFPLDFLFRATPEELDGMRSQFVIASGQSQPVTGSRRNVRHLPYAFTEHGALMAATVLNSPRAVAMSLYIIRAFVKMREDIAANATILKRLAEIDTTLLHHDGALREIFQKLRPLLEPPPVPPKPEIGFHIKEDAVPYRIKKTTRPILNGRPTVKVNYRKR